ncbi:MAG: QueT transporter family protein [Erysipelotrichaceae bacterium]|nr:QueT transporter family protein [Erysipelotrichaceae bacterium]
MRRNKLYYISIVAAIYVTLCLILAPISFGPIQLRLSEILCLLAIEYDWAIIGLTIGCFVSNLLFGGLGIIDVVFGTFATFIGCLLAYKTKLILYKGKPILSSFMIVIVNAIIIGIEMGIIENSVSIAFITMIEIAISEAIIIYIIGLPLYDKMISIIEKTN